MTEKKTVKRTSRNGYPTHVKRDGKLYPKGFPETPMEGDEVDVGMPLDPESAAMQKDHELIMSARKRGEKVHLSGDTATRYMQCVQLYPNAYVVIVQTSPVQDESIPHQPLYVLPTYEDLKAFLRNNHWKGQQSIFQWKIRDSHNPNWAVGSIHFAANLDVARRIATGGVDYQQPHQQPPQHQYQPPQQLPQYPGYGVHGMMPGAPGMPPGPSWPMMPQWQLPVPVPPLAPTPSRESAGPSTETSGGETAAAWNYVGQMFNSMMQMQMQQLQQQQAQLQQFAAAAMQGPPQMAAQSIVAAAPPADPLQDATAKLEQLQGLVNIAKQFAGNVSPPAEAPAPPVGDTDDFPLQIKDIGPMRMVFDRDGNPASTGAMFMANSDKILAGVDFAITKIGNLITQAREEQKTTVVQTQPQSDPLKERQMKLLESHQDIERRKLALAERQPKAPPAPPAAPPAPAAPQPQTTPTESPRPSPVRGLVDRG